MASSSRSRGESNGKLVLRLAAGLLPAVACALGVVVAGGPTSLALTFLVAGLLVVGVMGYARYYR